jgi:hypothetical protein
MRKSFNKIINWYTYFIINVQQLASPHKRSWPIFERRHVLVDSTRIKQIVNTDN